MRSPTDMVAAYAWHRSAMLGHGAPVHDGHPQCGWYRRRMVKGGPWVPARIWLHQVIDAETGNLTEPEIILCEVDGKEEGAIHAWTWLARNPISQADYDAMNDEKAWAGSNDPTAAILNPTAPLDSARKPVFPGGR